MNCQEFQTVSVELARGQLVEASAREQATRHADDCARCTARLASEVSLAAALRSTRAQMFELKASPRVEAALVAAFRARAAGEPVEAATVSALSAEGEPGRAAVARVVTGRFGRSGRRAVWAAAVAASLVLAVVAVRRALMPAAESRSIAEVRPRANGGTETIQTVPAVNQNAEINSTAGGGRENATGNQLPTGNREVAVSGQVARRARSSRASGEATSAAIPVTFNLDGGRAVDASAEDVAVAGGADVSASASASEFVQLAGAGNAAPLESGQMVRVNLPRSALAAMGLTVSAERAGESVQADVLLGHDGTARAIRVVPERSQVAGLR